MPNILRDIPLIESEVDLVRDRAARLDERLKEIVHRYEKQDDLLGLIGTNIQMLVLRVLKVEQNSLKNDIKADLEYCKAKSVQQEQEISLLKHKQGEENGKWAGIISFGFQLALGVLTAYLIWRLALK
ncbi:hypothetical protein TA3x_004259 [Tundrisphaera sp. TA3]|uniref:hypothetical protein n=1 Tax=Tundrisphaera sp. TA3 TaxID=3435775 RepID=UPI003EBA7DBC